MYIKAECVTFKLIVYPLFISPNHHGLKNKLIFQIALWTRSNPRLSPLFFKTLPKVKELRHQKSSRISFRALHSKLDFLCGQSCFQQLGNAPVPHSIPL